MVSSDILSSAPEPLLSLSEYFSFLVLIVSCLHFGPCDPLLKPDYLCRRRSRCDLLRISSCRVEHPLHLSKVLDITEPGRAGVGPGRGWGGEKQRAVTQQLLDTDQMRLCHKSPRSMSDAACLLFYTEGHSQSKIVLILSFVLRQTLSAQAVDLGRAPTTIPHPTNQMNPTGKAGARNAIVHFTAAPAPSASQTLHLSPGPRECSL